MATLGQLGKRQNVQNIGKAGSSRCCQLFFMWHQNWIPKSTLIAYSGCNRPATVVTSLSRNREKVENHNTLQNGKLNNKSNGMSPRVTVKKRMRPAGFEPATFGLGNRCSILLSYERDSFNCMQYNNFAYATSTTLIMHPVLGNIVLY
jgi:hypothetical protein